MLQNTRQRTHCLFLSPLCCTAVALTVGLQISSKDSVPEMGSQPRGQSQAQERHEITSRTIWAVLLLCLLKSSPQLIPFRGLCPAALPSLQVPASSMRGHDPSHCRIAVHNYSHLIIFVTDLRLFSEVLKISKGHLSFLLRHSIFLCLIERFEKKNIFLLSINMTFR